MWMHLYLKMDSLIKCFLFSNVFLFLGHWWRTGSDWDECWSKRRMTFPPNWCNSGFKGGRCPGCCKRCESDVTYGQEWWPILGICALQLSHPKCTHTAVNTHTPWTHTRSSGQPFMLRCPGSSWGFGALFKGTSVVVLRVERALYIHSPHLQFLPATFGLRVRLSNHWATTSPMSHAVLMGLLHDYISYAKEIMKIGSDAWSVFMDYETNCKCIICKNQMLNACSVLFSRNGVYTLSFIHMLTFFHTHMLLLMLWFICVLSCQNSL